MERCMDAVLGGLPVRNLGPRAAEYRPKPCSKTQNNAERSSKMLFWAKPWAQEVSSKNLDASTIAEFLEFPDRGSLMRTFRELGMFVFFAALALAIGVQSSAAQEAGQLKAGDPAPAFSLQGSDGKTYRLADLRGKQAVVLVWFVKAFSAG